MCGIAGRWDVEQVGGLGEETLSVIRHRGPDDAGSATYLTRAGRLELLQARLSILDPSPAGHQPMTTADGRYTIVLNGEIYNFRQLRRELSHYGTFRSHSDTEVVLQAFARWGTASFRMLDGMFALAIWDNVSGALTLARDPLGIKPLYVSESHGLVFASELKALLAQPWISRRLRVQSVAEYLSFLWIPEPHTMFEDIEQLPAGHYAIYRAGRREARVRYFDLRDYYHRKLRLSESEALSLVSETLRQSVHSQMVSDVPIGAFFSGGLDSTYIIWEMAKAATSPVVTETVGFAQADYRYDIAPSDLRYARQLYPMLAYRIDYHETFVREPALDLFAEVVRLLDDPIGDPAAISMLMIARAAKPRATVMLSGMGAEELWGGYARYWATLSALAYWGKLAPSLQNLVRHVLASVPSSRPWPLMAGARQAKKYMRASGRDLADTFITFESYCPRQTLEEALMPAWRGADPWEHHRRLFSEAQGLEPLDQMSYVDALSFLPSLNLHYSDRASMASSVEVRVPFLSRSMIELACRLPSGLRLKGTTGKYMVRQAALTAGVPDNVVWRRKSGFGAPVRAWMSRQDHPVVERLLDPAVIRARGLLNADYVTRLRQLHRSGREDFGLELYSFMALEQWFRTYVDGDTQERRNTSQGGYRR